MKKSAAIFVLFLFVNVLFTIHATAQGPLLRFPDIHGDLVVFVHGEDIWSVPSEGGVATRLTIHDGEERFPRFSPDGNLDRKSVV